MIKRNKTLLTLFGGGGGCVQEKRQLLLCTCLYLLALYISTWWFVFACPSALELNLKTSQFKPINYKKAHGQGSPLLIIIY